VDYAMLDRSLLDSPVILFNALVVGNIFVPRLVVKWLVVEDHGLEDKSAISATNTNSRGDRTLY
jgi:hypothetical protein